MFSPDDGNVCEEFESLEVPPVMINEASMLSLRYA